LIGFLFFGAVLIPVIRPKESEDSLDSGHQVRTWSSD